MKKASLLALLLSAPLSATHAEGPQQIALSSLARGAQAAELRSDAGTTPEPDTEASTRDADVRARAATRALLLSLMPEPGLADAGVPAPDPARVLPRASVLGIPPAPRTPKVRTQFDFSTEDPAGEAARSIAQRVAAFPNLRAQSPGAVWVEDARARFAIRATEACMSALARAGIHAHPVARALSTPVAVPVVIDAPIEGVAFVSLHADREIELSCELALRLRPLARILKAHGVLAVGINSSYRDRPQVSFHTFGLALDMMAFRTRSETLVVAEHFEVSADTHTCEASPSSEQSKALLRIVCALAESRLFSTILTPNYNEGHRDHVHLDARPDDPRLFVR